MELEASLPRHRLLAVVDVGSWASLDDLLAAMPLLTAALRALEVRHRLQVFSRAAAKGVAPPTPTVLMEYAGLRLV